MVETSPYAETLSLILSQGDFVKGRMILPSLLISIPVLQTMIKKINGMLYCISSGVKLLPTFVSKLAEAFINGEDYFFMLRENIC